MRRRGRRLTSQGTLAMPVFVVLLARRQCRGHGQAADERPQTAVREGRIPERPHLYRERQCRGRAGRRRRLRPRPRSKAKLKAYAGKPVGVIVRTAAEMAKVVAEQPLPGPGRERHGRHLPRPRPASRRIEKCQRPGERGDSLGAREIYVHYPDGMGRSKLRIPAAERGDRAQHEHRRQARGDGGGVRRPSVVHACSSS